MDTLAANAKAISVETFKQQVLMWEYIITAIIFLASYFVLKRYKKNHCSLKAKTKSTIQEVKRKRGLHVYYFDIPLNH